MSRVKNPKYESMSLEELKANMEKSRQELEVAIHNKNLLEQRKKLVERRERSHRLIVKGAEFEKAFPLSKDLEQEEFQEVMNQMREYILDEDGNRVKDAKGKEMFNAVSTTGWNDPELLKEWRRAWTEKVNGKFRECHMAARIDHRSYKEQGIDLIPTIHEGYEVRAMEKKEIKTVIGELNRANEVRPVFRKLGMIAERTVCAIVLSTDP